MSTPQPSRKSFPTSRTYTPTSSHCGSFALSSRSRRVACHVEDDVHEIDRDVLEKCSPKLALFLSSSNGSDDDETNDGEFDLIAVLRVRIDTAGDDDGNPIPELRLWAPRNEEDFNLNSSSLAELDGTTAYTVELPSIIARIIAACNRQRMERFTNIESFFFTVEIADKLGFLPVLEADFNWAALDAGLDAQIVNNPFGFMVAAARLRSERMYREAFVHAVGKYPMYEYEKKIKVNRILLDLPARARVVFEREAHRVFSEFLMLVMLLDNEHNVVMRQVRTGKSGHTTFKTVTYVTEHVWGTEGEYIRGYLKRRPDQPQPPTEVVSRIEKLSVNNSALATEQFKHLACAQLDSTDLPWKV